MKELEKIKAKFREMVAYCMDTNNSEIVDNYTETFLEIYKEGVAKIEKERDELKKKLDSKSFEVLNEKTFTELQTLKDAVKQAISSMDEIMNLMDDVRTGDYIPDSFTNQPIEISRDKLKELIKMKFS